MTGMIIGRGGSGAALRITSAAELPASGKENEIVIISDTLPGTVYAQPAKPDGAADGDVWIASAGADVAVNLAKKGTIEIQLGSVYQMADSGWTQKAAYIYQGGTWLPVEGSTMLYDLGAQFDAMTGGWQIAADGTGDVSFEDGSILIETTTSATRKGAVTASPCPTARHSRVCAEVEVLSLKAGTTQINLGAHTSSNPKVGTSSVTSTSKAVYPTRTGVTRIEYEYSSTEDLYVWISLANATAAQIRVLRVWLE